jgi:hypothetical protein
MNIGDLVGLSKPLERLIDVISRGVGAVYSPHLIRKNADAKAYEIKMITNALDSARRAHNLPIIYNNGEITTWQKPDDGTLILEDTSIEARAERRLEYTERRRQNNIENITGIAAAELAGETDIGAQQPDDDWIARFFTSAQDINSGQMQDLWGRILSGEIKKPGSYSLRTLDFIRNISSSEAELFERIGRLALRSGGGAYVSITDKKWLSAERGIREADHFLLAELGIMYPTDLQLTTFMTESSSETLFRMHDHLLLIRRGQIQAPVHMQIWKFTGIGLEMLPLLSPHLDVGYLEEVAKLFTAHKGDVTLGRVKEEFPDGRISFDIVKRFEVEQAGTGQPATRPESKPEGSDKTQPEAEGRSR